MTSGRWRALGAGTLICRTWPGEDEGVVFSTASGDLHLLNGTALAVLDHLAHAPCSLDQLRRRFPDADPALESLLASFDSLGLIRPIDP